MTDANQKTCLLELLVVFF
ncbi:BnaC08g48190D [Brassica napus]|uniref:BnaC08g48190D protein n=2 Tax=Brassica TaxID=3705 RepID=A0A078INC7_BRANA|nr:BnaC08g48190D [Brassica napus]